MPSLLPRFSGAIQKRRIALYCAITALGRITFGASTATAATGATIDWNGGQNSNWNIGNNWDGGNAPANDLTTNIARFDKTSYTNQPTTGNRSISGIINGDSATSTLALTITSTGSTFNIGGDGITAFANAGATTLTGGTLKIGASQSWANNSSNLLTISSTTLTNIGNTTPFTLTLNGSGTGGTTISSVISDGGTTGTTAVTMNTTGGVTTFSGNNLFTGGLTLTQGVLRAITSANALGLGTLTLAGGELQTAIGNTNYGRNTTVTGNAQITSDRAASSSTGVTATFGALSIGAQTLTIARGSNITGAGVGGVTFGATTLTGNAIFNAGANTLLTLGDITGGTNTLTLNGGTGSLTLSGSSSNTSGLVTATTGTLNLSKSAGNAIGANGLTVNGATATLAASNQIDDAATLTLSSGAVGISSFSDTIGNLSVTGGSVTGASGVITVASGGSTSISNPTTFSAGLTTGTSGLSLTTGTLSGALMLNGNLTVNAGGGGSTLSGGITINAVQSWANNNGNTLTVSGAVTYSNLLTLNGGAFQFNTAGTGAGGVKITNNSTVTNGSSGAIFGSGTLELNSGTYEPNLNTDRTLANVLSITGDFTFGSLGIGASIFTGGGSTTGNRVLTVNSVTTQFTTNALALGGNLTTAGTGALTISGGLNLGAVDRTISGGAAGATTISGAVDFSASGHKLVLAGDKVTLGTMTPGATNTVNFEVNATGAVTFSGASTYVGTTTLTTGELSLGSSSVVSGGVLASGPVGKGTFHIGSGTNAATLSTNVSSGTTRTVQNNITLDGDVTFAPGSGQTTGRIALDTFTSLTTPNTFTLTRTNQLTVVSSETVDFIGAITGSSFGFTKLGAGTLNLGNGGATDPNANTFNGLTIVNAGLVNLRKGAGVDAIAGDLLIDTTGTVALGNNDQINNNSSVTVNGGGILNLNGSNETIDALNGSGTVTNNSGVNSTRTLTTGGNNGGGAFSGTLQDGGANKILALTKSGSGTLTLTGNNTFTGATVISANGGKLQAAADGALGSGTTGTSGITVNSGGTLALTNSSATDRIKDTASLTLVGGTLQKLGAGVNEGTITAVGMGALTLTAIGSKLDYTQTSGTLTFTSFSPGAFMLSIINYIGNGSPGGTDQLIFMQDQSTNSNLAHFDFGFGAGVNVSESSLGGGFFEVYSTEPIPEPSTWLAGALIVGSLLVSQHRRLSRLLKRAA